MSRHKYFMSRRDFIEWCCDRVFYVKTQSTKERRLLVTTEGFYVATEFRHAKSFHVAIECFYVAIELAKVGRISIAIGDFYVAIELATIKSSVAHDRARRAKASAHDSVALTTVWRCVTS